MTPDTRNINMLWSSVLVEEFHRCGVGCFCVASGSRSSPLVAAVAAREGVVKTLHVDERGAAYYAVGYARATGRPAVCITTSGTAAANCLPAVVEASNDSLPLIVLTADRPPELRDAGANQAIDQVKIFGDFPRWTFDMPCPDERMSPEFVLTTADHAYARAAGTAGGPVHLNCMFREPLEPSDDGLEHSSYLDPVSSWCNGDAPYTRVSAPTPCARGEDVERVEAALGSSEKGLIIVGGLGSDVVGRSVLRLAETLRWPLLPDVISGLRLGVSSECVIPYYDQILLSESFAARHHPDVVLHLGGPSVSKRLSRFLNAARPRTYVRVQDHPRRRDPNHQVSHRIESCIADFCDRLSSRLEPGEPDAWVTAWQQTSQIVRKVIEREVPTHVGLTEPFVARRISELIEPGHGLFVAGSMPVRDLDMYGSSMGPSVRVAANRGASGIDGTIATAAGFACGLDSPVTLSIGDLAFLHDVNSLALLRKGGRPVTIVLLNNNGGGIYSFLPISGFPALLDEYFAMPHGMTFEGVADSFGLDYARPDSEHAFGNAYREAIGRGTSTLIEVVTDRTRNRGLHEQLQEKIRNAIG